MVDLSLEIVRSLVLAGIVLFLWRVGRGRFEVGHKGWRRIIAGFALLLFGSLLDITDNFAQLGRFVVLGDTATEAFLEKFVGYSGGFVLLAWGLYLWVPRVGRLSAEVAQRRRAEEGLERYRDQLEQKIDERTAQLRESEQRYRGLFDTATAGIGRTLLKDGRVILSNKKLAQIFGYDRVEDYISEFVFSEHYVDPDDRKRLMESYEKSPGTPIQCAFSKRDGSTVIVQAHALANHEKGYLDFFAVDITEQKQAEQALLESEGRLRSLMDNSPNLICLKDVEGRYQFLNRKFEEELGVTRTNVLGKTAQEVFPKDLAGRFDKHDADVFANRDVIVREEYGIPGVDGVKRDYISCRFPLFDLDGKITGLANIDTDITEHRATQEQLQQSQKMEAVGQLTGGIAHDFNNLLAVVQGNAELLAEAEGSKASFTGPILMATARGSELTQRLLAFSRQQPLSPQAIDLGALVSGMSEMLARTLRETIEIEIVVDPNLRSVFADPGQVENALLNLTINARDAMPDGGKLTIDCTNARPDDACLAENSEANAGDFVLLTVSDEGNGMTAEVQAHAFEPFFTTKKVGQGSGLGLSMVYGFARQSGGHVKIQSRVHRGTTVKLYLPKATTVARTREERKAEPIPKSRGELVLVIEDDPDVRALAVKMLESMCYRVTEVEDAASAGEALLTGPAPDLVLSDVVLPGGTSGPAFAEEARRSYPGLKFIFMSGYPAEAAKRDGFQGPDGVLLNKPFQRRQLAQALRAALD